MSLFTIGWVIQTTRPRLPAGLVRETMVGLALPEPSAEPPQATPAELSEYFGAMACGPPSGSRLLPLGWVMSVVQAKPPITNAPISLAVRIMVLPNRYIGNAANLKSLRS